MPKIRSQPLYDYLLKSGVLEHGTDEDIRKAKAQYRSQYKKEWKKKRPKREVRIGLDEDAYTRLQTKATMYGENPTAFAREVVLESLGRTILIPNRKQLEEALQELSLGLNTLLAAQDYQSYREQKNAIKDYLLRAETLLLRYVK